MHWYFSRGEGQFSKKPHQLLILGIEMRLERYRLGEAFLERYSPILIDEYRVATSVQLQA
jgi:hypothetical protein